MTLVVTKDFSKFYKQISQWFISRLLYGALKSAIAYEVISLYRALGIIPLKLNCVTLALVVCLCAVDASSQEKKAPLFLKELYDMDVVEGDTIRFRCKVRAYPPPRVTWYKDGKRLDNDLTYKLGM